MKRVTPARSCFFLLFLSLLLASCAGNLYRPSVAYAPQLREKNDAEAVVTGGLGSGCQLQAAWAPTKELHLQAQANTIGRGTGNVLGGIGYRWVFPLKNSKDAWFVTAFSAGYSAGQNARTEYRTTGRGTTGLGAQPGYLLYDMKARWHGGYFQYTFGMWVTEQVCFYAGGRTQWLNCSSFRYSSSFFALEENGGASRYVPGLVQTVDPSNGFTTITDLFTGLTLGKTRLKFLFQVQWRYQYTGANLNDHWQDVSVGEVAVGLQYRFGKMPQAQ